MGMNNSIPNPNNIGGFNNPQDLRKGNLRKDANANTNSVPQNAPSVNPSDLNGMNMNGMNGMYGMNGMPNNLGNNQNQFMGMNNNNLPNPQMGMNQGMNPNMNQQQQQMGGMNFPMNGQMNNMMPNRQVAPMRNKRQKTTSQII